MKGYVYAVASSEGGLCKVGKSCFEDSQNRIRAAICSGELKKPVSCVSGFLQDANFHERFAHACFVKNRAKGTEWFAVPFEEVKTLLDSFPLYNIPEVTEDNTQAVAKEIASSIFKNLLLLPYGSQGLSTHFGNLPALVRMCNFLRVFKGKTVFKVHNLFGAVGPKVFKQSLEADIGFDGTVCLGAGPNASTWAIPQLLVYVAGYLDIQVQYELTKELALSKFNLSSEIYKGV